VQKDEQVIEQIKERVELCREYYETLYNFLWKRTRNDLKTN
jgi:hypothetical protein